MMCLACIL